MWVNGFVVGSFPYCALLCDPVGGFASGSFDVGLVIEVSSSRFFWLVLPFARFPFLLPLAYFIFKCRLTAHFHLLWFVTTHVKHPFVSEASSPSNLEAGSLHGLRLFFLCFPNVDGYHVWGPWVSPLRLSRKT